MQYQLPAGYFHFKNVLKNYRPVSNITFVGKLIEKIACARLTEHMDSHNLADLYQSAYRARHSTESALIKVKNDIMMSIDNKKVVLLVLLNLSAAFGTIDHEILISRLSKRVGVTGTALHWFRSYLDGWTSRVDIAGELSDPITATFGLPQGSVVGPTGYSIYTYTFISRIRRFIDKDACHHAVRSLILSRLDYCNGLQGRNRHMFLRGQSHFSWFFFPAWNAFSR